MTYFHIEDAFEQRINYETNTQSYQLINKAQADTFIANEIRLQVNSSQQRSIYSVSKSLGIVLFKYNKIGDNPLHIIPVGYLNHLEVALTPDDIPFIVPYDIQNTSSLLNEFINQESFYLYNYVIDVSNNVALDQYLRTYTPVGKHPYAACEKDKEVLIRHIAPNFTIADEIYIDAVYLIYALNHRYGFLSNLSVLNQLKKCCQSYTQDNEEAYHGFNIILDHLQLYQRFEYFASNPVILEKQKLGRFTCDMYYIALEILDTTLEDSLVNAWNDITYYCNYKFLYNIWEIFWQWKLSL